MLLLNGTEVRIAYAVIALRKHNPIKLFRIALCLYIVAAEHPALSHILHIFSKF